MPNNARSFGPVTGRMGDFNPKGLLGDRQLIVVSNRQPYRHDYDSDGNQITVDRPTGGLTVGLDPVMQQTGGTWIAWGDGDADSEVANSNDSVPVPPANPTYSLKRIWLSDEQVRDYYYGFSNQVLWPICHSALTRVRCDPGFWRRYRRVNEQFVNTVVDIADRCPLVWFQDYHLALAPKLVRPHLPENALVMHFWHIPWPSWDTYRACPHHRELLEGLLGNDLLGFHAPRYQTNFLGCVDATLEEATVDWETSKISYRGQVTRVVAIPMGVPVNKLRRSAATPGAKSFWPSFQQTHDIPSSTRIAVGIDRIDYTKGIVERLRALERLWETFPGWRGDLTYIQNGSESRSRIPAYREVQERVTDEIERINQRFGTDNWKPIVNVNEHLSREQLCSLYRHADVAIVSPIRDGLNLVAQEYVAAQIDDDGVLVLSDQAGVHDELGGHAVTITPSDTEGFAEAISGALAMSPAERRHRMRHLRQWVEEHTLNSWFEENFRVALETTQVGTQSLPTAWPAGESRT